MQQLEIRYFFPLTEQVALNLDFKPCIDYDEEQRKKQTYTDYTLNSWSTVGTLSLQNTISFHPSNDSAGYWKVGEGLQMHNKKKPSWLHQEMTRIFFGWKWIDNENRN